MLYTHILVTGEAGHGKDTVADYLGEKLGYKKTAFADLQKKEVIDSYSQSPKKVDIVWLNIRETKETPDYRLALENCSDKDFVSVALEVYKQEDAALHRNICDGETNRFHNDGLTKSIRNQSHSIASGKSEFTLSERLSLPRSPRRITQVWGTEYRRESIFGHKDYWIAPVDEALRTSKVPFGVTDGRTSDEINWGRAAGLQRIEVVNPRIQKKVAKHVTEMIPATDEDTIIISNDSSLEDLFRKIDSVIPVLAKPSTRPSARLKP